MAASKPAPRTAGAGPKKGNLRAKVTTAASVAQPELAPALQGATKAHETVFGAKGRLAPGASNRLLLAEFLICLTILGLGTIIAPSGSAKGGVPRLMLKSTAFAGVFLILALTSATGEKGAKAAAGLGGLVTLAYTVTSPDAVTIFNWMGSAFGGSVGVKTASKAGSAIGNVADSTPTSTGAPVVSGIGGGGG